MGGEKTIFITTVKPPLFEHLWCRENLFRDIGSSSHCGLIMAPGQKVNGDNLGSLLDLLYNNGMLNALI